MGKTLIVCEKPSAAVKIASALAAKRPEEGEFNGVLYYEFKHNGEQMVIVPALGHVVFYFSLLIPFRSQSVSVLKRLWGREGTESNLAYDTC